MQLGIKANVVAITHLNDGAKQRLDIDFFLSRSVRAARRRQEITSPFRERSFSFACYLSSR